MRVRTEFRVGLWKTCSKGRVKGSTSLKRSTTRLYSHSALPQGLSFVQKDPVTLLAMGIETQDRYCSTFEYLLEGLELSREYMKSKH
jgi:hypothetical protein